MDRAPAGDPRPVSEAISIADRRVARWLGVCALLLYLPFVHGHFFGTDETSVFEVTRSLYHHGTFEVKWEAPYHRVGRDGRTYSHFAVGQSVLALPFYGLGRAIRSVSSPRALQLLKGRPRSGGKVED